VFTVGHFVSVETKRMACETLVQTRYRFLKIVDISLGQALIACFVASTDYKAWPGSLDAVLGCLVASTKT